MLRGYRIALFAVAGLILIGAGNSPKTDNQPQNSKPQNKVAKAARPIPSAVTSVDIPVEKDLGCKQGNDNRNSNLCAEWKAADAARDAAEYSLWGLGIGIVGTAFLVLTFWETRKTSRAQLRAYVGVEVRTLRINAPDGKASVDLDISNNGVTPAFKAKWAGNIVISTLDQIERDLLVTPDDNPKGRATETTIHGGNAADGTLHALPDLKVEDLQAVIAGEKSIYILGFVWYDDAFGCARQTKFCYSSGQVPGPNEPLREDIDYRWSMTPFHNDAT